MNEMVRFRTKMQKRVVEEYVQASNLVPTLAYDEEKEYFILDDKHVAIGFMCEPMSGFDAKIQERVAACVNQNFPHDTILQFCLYKSPDINRQMYSMMALRDSHNDAFLRAAVHERKNFFQKYTAEQMNPSYNRSTHNLGLIYDLKLFISLKLPIADNIPTDEEIIEIEQWKVKVLSQLKTVGLNPYIADADVYIRFMNTIVNWNADTSWRHDGTGWDKNNLINRQLFDYSNSIECDKTELKLGEQFVSVMSAKKLPERMFFGDAMRYVGDLSGMGTNLKENYMIVTNVYYPNPDKTKSKFDKKRQFTVNQAVGPITKYVPSLLDKKNDLDAFNDSLVNGNRVVRMNYAIVLFAPTKKRLDGAISAANSIWRETHFEMFEDKHILMPMFVNCLPFCADYKAVDELQRYKTLTTEHIVPLLPIFGEWKGTGTYHSALISRNGQLMSLSLHDSQTNKNFVIAAQSGSGKSFLVNELIVSYMSEGAQVWVIDVGRSYEKLCETLKGDFVHFANTAQISLNPFELVTDYQEEEDTLCDLVAAMASPKNTLTEFQMSALKAIMTKLWDEHGKSMTLDQIQEQCVGSDEPRIRDMGIQLGSFASTGSYGKYFSESNNVNFKSQLTVLELDDLQGRTHLRQVVLLQLIYQIQQAVYLGDRSVKKLVIIDEAWDLLKDESAQRFIEAAYRKFRKYGGSIGIATQSVNDLYSTDAGVAIAENAASMYLLGQKEESIDMVKREGRMSMSEGGYHALKTVHTLKGLYSEVFVRSETGIGIGRLIVAEFQKLLYSTDPADITAIKHYQQQGLSMEDSINAVIRDRQG